MDDIKTNRILLKISGESFSGAKSYGHDFETITNIAKDILKIKNSGVQICIVVGGGNIMRGRNSSNITRAVSDYSGMLATIMNAIILQDIFTKIGTESKVFSSIPVNSVCLTYSRNEALSAMKDSIVIFAGGTGNPFVSTDTAAVCRAIEMECDILIKATQVDGIYSADPKKNTNVVRYNELKYDDVINNKNLLIIDLSAIFIAKEYRLQIMISSISNLKKLTNISRKNLNYTLIN